MSEIFNEADWEGSGTIDLLEFKSAMLNAYREYKKAGLTVVRRTDEPWTMHD